MATKSDYAKRFKLKVSISDDVFRTYYDETILSCNIVAAPTGVEFKGWHTDKEVLSRYDYRLLLKAALRHLKKELDLFDEA